MIMKHPGVLCLQPVVWCHLLCTCRFLNSMRAVSPSLTLKAILTRYLVKSNQEACQHSCHIVYVAPILALKGQWLSRCFHPTLGTVSSIGRALTSVRRLRVRFPYCPVEIQGSSSSHCPVLSIASCITVAWSTCWAHCSSVYLWLSCFGADCLISSYTL